MTDNIDPDRTTPVRAITDFRLPRLITRGLAGISGLTLFALMIMTCIDVFGRYLFNSPLDGATELTTMMMAVIVFAGLPLVTAEEAHISVDILDRWMAPIAVWRDALINLLGTAAMCLVCWQVWRIAGRNLDYGDRTEFLQVPLYPVSYFIAVMSAVTAVLLLGNVAVHLILRTTSEKSGEHFHGIEYQHPERGDRPD